MYSDGKSILSREGTTQGDPLAMAMFAPTTLPLVNKLSQDEKQCCYADDASAGVAAHLGLAGWSHADGSQYGYLSNAEKT